MSVVNEIISQAKKNTANKEINDERMKRETNRECRERNAVRNANELESIGKRVEHLRATVQSTARPQPWPRLMQDIRNKL